MVSWLLPLAGPAGSFGNRVRFTVGWGSAALFLQGRLNKVSLFTSWLSNRWSTNFDAFPEVANFVHPCKIQP